MKTKCLRIALLLFVLSFFSFLHAQNTGFSLFPQNGSQDINPDTHLIIKFQNKPILGNKGFIRIYEVDTNRLVDSLDMSIPAGPSEPDMIRKKIADYTKIPYKYESINYTNANTIAGTPSGTAIRDTSNYQLTIIGRFTDGFRFYPVIIHQNTVTIYPHNNLLEYHKKYYVTVDEGVITTEDNSFKGIMERGEWQFSTKEKMPDSDVRKLVVDAGGTGDFNTVQGAMDFIPDFSTEKWEVFVKNGDYEELVYFRNKSNVTIKGESRAGVTIHYANNETFNPHPINVKTNEWPGTFPSRRAAFAADNCCDLRFEDLTIKTTLTGQAEGLLIMGERNYLKNVHIIGSGDALQANGSVYLEGCYIEGHGDTILGRGPAFFRNCTLSSRNAFMWIRNTEANHGNVFIDCTFLGQGNKAYIARSRVNTYPYAEAVLINCKLDNVPAEGWSNIYCENSHNNYLEYNSRTLNGELIDYSQRDSSSRQLYMETDKEIIEKYSSPEMILGWNPE